MLFHDNEANSGGAVYAWDSSVTIDQGTQFTENQAVGAGALYLTSGSSGWIEGAIFRDNRATGAGGALIDDLGGEHLEVRDSAFCGNRADNAGDGVYALDGSVYMGHTLLQDHEGEAFYGSGNTSAEFRHLTVIGNGDGLDPGSGDLKLQDSLFWDNAEDLASFGDSASGTHNAFESAPPQLPAGQIEVLDPGFVSWFDGSCDTLPFLSPDSVLAEAASDGTEVGAFPIEEPDTGPMDSDSAPPDSLVDSPSSDSGADTSLDSQAPSTVGWVSGGCDGPGPGQALLLVGLGIWLLQRGTNSSGPRRSSRK